MITPPLPQDELLRVSMQDLKMVDSAASRLVQGLSQAQLEWIPPDGGWSLAQVFDHVATASSSYFDRLEAAVRGGVRRGSDAAPWSPTLFGRLLIRSLDPSTTRRSASPRVWRPAPTPPPGAVDRFLASQSTLARLLREAEDVDLVRTRLSSPVSRLIRMNLGDALRVLVVHGQRHLGQMQRVLARPTFPPPGPPQ